jgi:DNA primase
VAEDTRQYLTRRHWLDEAIGEGWACLAPPGPCAESWVRLLRGNFEAAELSGLTYGRGFAYPHNRLIIPWRGPDGSIATIQRRRLDSVEQKKYVFPSGRPATDPYGIERLTGVSHDVPVVFVEGAMDVLALRAIDRLEGRHRIILGVPGGGWRRDWATYATGRSVYLASDDDPAGDGHAKRWAMDLTKAKSVRRLRAMDGNDWCEVLQRVAAERKSQ